MRENTSLEDGATVALDAIEVTPDPVFVDDTGKRRRRIRLAFYTVGAVSLTYAGLVAVSLLGGPLKPESLIPFPETFNRPAAAAPTPMTGEAARLAKKTARPGPVPHPSGKSGTANPANAIVNPPLKPGANTGTTGTGVTPTPETTPTPTPTTTPSPTPPPPPPTTPAPSATGTNPAPGGQGGGGGGGGGATAAGGQPEDTNTGTVVPIATTPIAAPNPAPVDTSTATATGTSTGTSSASSNPAPSSTGSPAAQL